MGFQPTAAPLPPNRAWWIKAMPPHRRLTFMLVEELTHLQATRKHGDASEIRGFLERFRAVTRQGNVLGAELGIRKAKLNMAVVYAHIPGVGAVTWFPALVLPLTSRIARVMVESGVAERFPIEREPPRDVWGQPERKRPPVLPRVAIRMVGH